MIDTHCHIDQYKDPLNVVDECERLGIITIGVTNLPSHFEMGYKHVIPYKKVRLALGMHPLYAEQHDKEFAGFVKNLSKTSYIGEIGLDFSKEGFDTKEIQVNTFTKILKALKGHKKILSVHSRKAEKEVLFGLNDQDIKVAIFHWYSGPLSLIPEIIDSGYYFSINPAMIKSKSGQEIISRIPMNRILTESDGPFIEIQNKPIRPANVNLVESYLSTKLMKSEKEISQNIHENFKDILSFIR